ARRHGHRQRLPRAASAHAPGAARVARHAAGAGRARQGARRAARGRARPAAQLLRGSHVPRRRRGRAHAHVRSRILDPAQPQRADAARRSSGARGPAAARCLQRRRARAVRQAHAGRPREAARGARDAPRRRARDVPRPLQPRGARPARRLLGARARQDRLGLLQV
ncbi:MAG: Transcriptional regulator, MarR family, partial [uncultured Solirubrobacteraceae bacterium]